MGIIQRMFGRRPPVPDSAGRYLQKEERALAWAQAVTGQVLVATPRGLHVVNDEAHRLVAWHEISKATWGERWLTVIESRVVEGSQIVDEQAWRLEFDEPGGVPPVLRRRIESAVVVSARYPLAGGALIVGRKVAGRDGLLWQYRLDREHPLSPLERAELERAVETERSRSTPADL